VTKQQPIGIIQSLSSGFDTVARHPDLMLLPILLDAFLWLGPRLSAYPLFRSMIDLLQVLGAEAIDSATRQQAKAMQNMLEQAGQALNLFSWLSPTPLGVPSLMAGEPALRGPNGPPTVWQVSNLFEFLVLFCVLSVIGLALSAVYWSLLSSRVCEAPLSLGRIMTVWWGLFKIAVILIVLMVCIGVPTTVVASLVGSFSSGAMLVVMLMGLSVMVWALFYLMFTVHGVALRNAAVLEAVRLSILFVQFQGLPTIGLAAIAFAIYLGLGVLWGVPPADSWLKAAAILGHAFIATGLIAATGLFYLNRVSQIVDDGRQLAAGSR